MFEPVTDRVRRGQRCRKVRWYQSAICGPQKARHDGAGGQERAERDRALAARAPRSSATTAPSAAQDDRRAGGDRDLPEARATPGRARSGAASFTSPIPIPRETSATTNSTPP